MNLFSRCWQNRWIRRLVWTAVTLVTLLALLCTWVNWSGARQWSKVQALLKAEGEPLDFRATLNEPLPDAENFCAIPLLKDLALIVDNDPSKGAPGERRKRLEALKLPSNGKGGARPGLTNATLGKRADLQAWAGWLRQEGSMAVDSGDAARDVLAALSKHDAVIQELAAGLDRPQAQWTPEWKTRELPPLLPTIAIPHYSAMQGLNQTLALRATAAARAGEAAKAHETALVIARLNQACLNDPFLIGLLVGASGAGILQGATWELCQAHAGTAEDFTRLESALSGFDFHRSTLHAWRSEMAGMVDTMQFMKGKRDSSLSLFQMVNNEGNPSGGAISNYFVRAFPGGFFDASTAVLADRELHYLIRPLREEGWQAARQSAEDWEKELVEMKKQLWAHPSYLMTSLIAPASKGIINRAACTQTLVSQAVIACALERYRIETGSYPNSLAPVKLAAGKPLPPDAINGKPMSYRKTADGNYTLWSVGFDGKDDGGKRVLDKKKPENTNFTMRLTPVIGSGISPRNSASIGSDARGDIGSDQHVRAGRKRKSMTLCFLTSGRTLN
ncbi:MAG: hypothetical protein QOE70_3364 [Chthoniobacter sp.]|jgi:hypothetical protein|nr:hypothetical protein [Chthoniobacter sp.]